MGRLVFTLAGGNNIGNPGTVTAPNPPRAGDLMLAIAKADTSAGGLTIPGFTANVLQIGNVSHYLAMFKLAVAAGQASAITVTDTGTPTTVQESIAEFSRVSATEESSLTVTNKALTTNVATLTVGAHSLIVGNTVMVSGVDATFDGTYVLTAVTGTTISYAKTATNVTSVAASGSVTQLIVTNGGATAKTSQPTGSINTTSTLCLVVAYLGLQTANTATSIAIDSGFTILAHNNQSAMAIKWAPLGSYNPVWSWPTSSRVTTAIRAFQATEGVGGFIPVG